MYKYFNKASRSILKILSKSIVTAVKVSPPVILGVSQFIKELGSELPFISENGSSIHGLNLINSNFPNKIILSRDKDELFRNFQSKVPNELKNKCRFIKDMNEKQVTNIFGLKDKNLKNALNRKYTVPLLFEGNNIPTKKNQ